MSNFPGEYRIRLKQNTIQGNEVVITEDARGGFTVLVSGDTWTFAPGSDDGCKLTGGTTQGTNRLLDVFGSCTLNVPGTRFLWVIGVTRDPSGPPDDQIAEWVAEDQGG